MTEQPSDRSRLAAERRRQAAELRAAGLTIKVIAQRLNVSTAAVSKMLGEHRVVPVRCRECGQSVGELPGHHLPSQGVLCLACLAKQPEASFADRLRTFRVSACLPIIALARKAGVPRHILDQLENRPDRCVKWPHLLRLIRTLGLSLVALGLEHVPRTE